MGGADEHLQGAGRGDHPQRAGIQLTNDAPEAEPAQPPIPQAYQLSLFPTEEEQIAYIAEAESYTPSAFSMSIPQSDIDHILRMEGNADYARMKIATEFSKGKSVEEIAAFLQSSFHGGNGVVTENGRYSAWYAEDGIHIANGDAARYLTSAKVVSWQEAAVRISELLEKGEYTTNVELAEAPGHERAELAQSIWYLRQDLSEKARAQGYLSCLSDMRGGGFPEETARLAGRLTDPAFREVLMDDFAQLQSDCREDRSLLRFHYHKPDKIEQGLRELSLPRREYRTEMAEIPAVQRFITEDEIAATLTRGSNIEGSKGRIYAYFKEKHSPKEQADFLKDEYGIGGRSHAVSGASHSGEDHSGKGVVLKKQDCPDVQLKWSKVASRISELIRKDRFLTPEEKTQYEQLQRQTAERSAAWNDYNAVKEAHPDDIVLFQVGDFFEMYGEDAKQAAELLNMNLTTRNIPGAGRVEICGVPSHNLEMYVEKLRDKYDVTIAEAPDFRGERHIYTLRSVDHEAEAAIDAQEAEFGADGTRVFRDPAAEQPQPTVADLFEGYKLTVGNALVADDAFLNACRNSDRENAYLEGAAAIRRIVMASEDLQLTRLYFDMPSFHNRLHQELLDELYPTLATTVTPSPYKVTQADIDAALQEWNGRIESKHVVVRYMKAHARDRDTAAWLAAEYGVGDSSKPLQISVGNSEPVVLSWAKVQRRIAQLIQSDNFYTEQEQDNFDNIDPIAIREALAERGIVNGQVVDAEANRNSPFIRQVMADVERIAAQEAQERMAQQEEPALDPADRFHVVSLDRGFRTLYAVWDDETHGYYVDADGVTEEFTSEWQAEAYRLELQGQAEQALLERAKGLISDFCQSEYGSEADFSDPAKIGVAYTTVTDDEIPVQVNIDLVNFRLERYLDDEHLETRQYASLQELITNELENLDFSDLIHVSDEDVEQYRWRVPEEVVAEAPETAPAPQREPFPYSAGDTVYLENGKPYIIESVGVFDITLSDPTLFYPISRAESRESFARLMERYPQPEKTAAENTAVPEKEPNHTYTEETVAVYPADKNNLPYDVEIRTLRFDEPEHDPPSAEPAKPEPPAMSEEEALLLEQEGRAALSEMGEFVPDFDDAISQAEIDEPPTHRHAVSISIDGEWQGFPSADAAEQAAYADFKAASHRNAQNFHITDDALGVGGAKAKFRANMAAINLLKELEFEGLQASLEQQEVLSRYVGWGGLADAFDESKDNWKAEFAELYATLSPEEYAAARASTLNAHYTSPTVIRAIYDAVENMGFQTGNILEPSMGVGNFFGMLPESMKSSRLYGVELDSITGRIAKQLYPKADITVAGFETTDRKDFFDLAVGNVPFGQYQVSDRAFDKLGFSIHNYFFAKALDQVRPGGVVAFVTSRYTMDAKDSAARKYIAQRADFLGAIRLPNNAFRANAGTDVVSDIIFLQKRDRPIEIEPDWVHTGIWRNPGANADGFAINQYFIDHPEMVLGRQTSESTQYGRQDFTVAPVEGADLAEQLSGAIRNIRGTYAEAELPDLGEDETIVETVPADPNVRNFSYTVVDGELYYRQNSIMTKPDFNATAKERAKGMVELLDCVQKLISEQMDGFISDETIRQTQAELNTLYDGFTAKYGLINSRANALAFAEDSSYYLLCSLEELDEDKNLKRKADMFTRRTIRAHEAVTSVDTASEALALSISEKACVDMEYMAQLTGKDEDALASDLRGVIFRNPENKRWETADEYLSGNVREKLRIAQSAQNLFEGDYAGNVEALKAAQPKDLDASEIEVRLGATWIDPSYIREFMWETFETPFYQQRMIDVNYSAFTAEWNIRNKNAVSYSNIAAYMTYGTERANAYKILEDTLNLRDVRIYDTKHDADGRERRVLNSKETTLAQQKQQAIRDAFRDWIWRDPDRRHTLVARYNELFNSTRPREYDGSHITFAGMNPEIRLREHQLNAVAHVLYGGNTLLAHEVGAGKTFEMVAAAMESKRLGLCHKSLFVVPNHLTEQWSGEFLRLYPSANILVATKKDFEPKNRKKFCARIATGEYDAVIIGHSQFEKIPVSMERQQRLLAEQIFEVEEGLRELKSQRAERFTIKSLERTKRGLEAKLKKLQDSSRKDDVVTFEQLGVDRLYVDEAHNYKNLFLYTKMRNVAGLSATDAQKSSDMLLKCRYIDEITDSRGVVFATGTPVSNSMTELYTMMRYLQHDAIRGKGLAHFDCWASTFGETQTAIELAPEGTGYRARTRFAKFFNLPELMTLFKEAADIKTSDQLNLPTPTPIYHNEVAQPTEIQKQMVQELSERAARVHAQLVDPGTDNMLKITSDGRKLGLDQRIINPDLPDDPNSKVNRCVDNIHRIWQDGQADRLTQLVFCDLSTPKTGATGAKAAKTAGGNLDSPELHALEAVIGQDAAEEPAFTIYDDIREKLVARGIPREQIAFIHEANTETRKKELFAKVRSGQVRVLMGSTFKMGAGMNVQDRLVALHDLDCPWRPGDLEQRSGRIIRQGNRNKEVHIYRYVTESTFDAYLWQTVENKQKFISQIMTSKSPVRSCEDVDETALSYAEIKALCAGDKRIKEKMDLDVDVARLKLMKASHQSQQFRLEDNLLRHFPEQIRQNESFVEGFTADMQTLAGHPHPVDGFAGMEVKGDLLTDKDNAGAAILEAFKDAKGMEPVPIGSYRGFAMSLTVEDFGRDFILTLKGKMNHRVTLGKDARGNLTRIDNALNAMPDRLQNVRNTLDALTAQMETAKAELGKPFPQEDELRTKSARLAELNAELNIDDRTPMEQMAEDAPAVQSAKAERPSVLAKLKAPLSQPCAEDKIRHRNKEER
ncbi:MAG: SNF2-related protein [Dysosmobacter sp.]